MFPPLFLFPCLSTGVSEMMPLLFLSLWAYENWLLLIIISDLWWVHSSKAKMVPKVQKSFCYYSWFGSECAKILFVHKLLWKPGDAGAQMAPLSSLLRPRPFSCCPSISTLFSPPSPCDVRWGLPCCDRAALITVSRTVCGSRYVIILQPGGHAEITQSTSALWCGSHTDSSRLPLILQPARCSDAVTFV